MMDRTTRTTVSTPASFRATSPEGRWVLGVGVRGGFSWTPWGPLWVSLRAGADVVLTPYSYTLESNDSVPSLGWARPRVELELAVWLW
jgi:hypothetical protein